MTNAEGEQIARIIYNVFEHEDQIDPRTIARMFQYMGRVGSPEEICTCSKLNQEELQKVYQYILKQANEDLND